MGVEIATFQVLCDLLRNTADKCVRSMWVIFSGGRGDGGNSS
jgi:hypothetical protein